MCEHYPELEEFDLDKDGHLSLIEDLAKDNEMDTFGIVLRMQRAGVHVKPETAFNVLWHRWRSA